MSSKARYPLLLASFFALSSVACGAQFDPQSELQTLRILAVQKDKPYAKPGEDVEMRKHFIQTNARDARFVDI